MQQALCAHKMVWMFSTGYGKSNARSACAPQTARCTPYRLSLLRDLEPEAERFSGDLALGGKAELLVLHSALLEVVNHRREQRQEPRSE